MGIKRSVLASSAMLALLAYSNGSGPAPTQYQALLTPDSSIGGLTSPVKNSGPQGAKEIEIEWCNERVKLFDTAQKEYLNSDIPQLEWPFNGPLTSYFGEVRIGGYHWGIDIGSSKRYGDPVSAAYDGKVVEEGWVDLGLGNYVVLEHGDFLTVYGHLSQILITEGEEVAQGQEIGTIGSTGNSNGPHLHFEVVAKERIISDEDLKRIDNCASLVEKVKFVPAYFIYTPSEYFEYFKFKSFSTNSLTPYPRVDPLFYLP